MINSKRGSNIYLLKIILIAIIAMEKENAKYDLIMT